MDKFVKIYSEENQNSNNLKLNKNNENNHFNN